MSTRKELQRAILKRLEDEGRKLFARELADLGEHAAIGREVAYLAGSGLITAATRESDGVVHYAWANITPKGSDFINADDTIGADVHVLTIKLHEDTIRSLLIARVRESEADDTVKGKLVDQLKSLPAEAVSKLAERALDQALRYMPNAIQWLQTAPWS